MIHFVNGETQQNQNKEFTISPGEINRALIFIFIPSMVVLSLPFMILWRHHILLNFKHILIDKFWLALPVFISGVIFHELLHGLTWALFADGGIKSVKFGFSKMTLTPYCHCKKPIRVKYYICGGLLPVIVLGVVPLLISMLTGNAAFYIFGLFFSLAAASDILICWKVRKLKSDAMVQDFPDKPGCHLVTEELDTK